RRRRSEEAALAERSAADERRRAKEAERAARAEERRRAQEELSRADGLRRGEQKSRDGERLAPDILSRIDHYGMTRPDPDTRRESATTRPGAAAGFDEQPSD